MSVDYEKLLRDTIRASLVEYGQIHVPMCTGDPDEPDFPELSDDEKDAYIRCVEEVIAEEIATNGPDYSKPRILGKYTLQRSARRFPRGGSPLLGG